ncbi:hypothetical protein LJC36_00835, partial [Desulfovibrio sp. OttesenSCG-928-C14]|nr:hypothetical protein [Desulfovibrio sp. OttesenSCG-928-C14]
HERLAGIWDVDDKASWEYQRPGEAYAPTAAELQRDISLQFDIQEQTCRALNAFGSHLLRYRVVAEEKDKATLVIGENTFIFEFKTDGRLLLCPPTGGVANCLILTRGSGSAEADRQAKVESRTAESSIIQAQAAAQRMAEVESRLAAIVKRHTQNVASRTEQFLVQVLVAPGERVAGADMFRLYVAEIDTLEGGQSKEAAQPTEDVRGLMNTMLREVVGYNNVRYARIYTSKGTMFLSSDMNVPQLSALQRKLILNAVATGEPGPIALISNGDELLFELYLPILRPYTTDEKDVAGVLAIARPMFPLPDECFRPDMPIPEGNLYFIQYTGDNYYQVIDPKGVKAKMRALEINDAGEMPFARRESQVGGGEVCSQASHGPVTNSWVLFETSCISPSKK